MRESQLIDFGKKGSGKTFAFGLPVLQQILELKEKAKNTKTKLSTPIALVLAPTRELALQITTNLKIAASKISVSVFISIFSLNSHFFAFLIEGKVVGIVGGIAPQKQERLLKKHPDIIVATPGRFWDLISNSVRIPHFFFFPSTFLHSLPPSFLCFSPFPSSSPSVSCLVSLFNLPFKLLLSSAFRLKAMVLFVAFMTIQLILLQN